MSPDASDPVHPQDTLDISPLAETTTRRRDALDDLPRVVRRRLDSSSTTTADTDGAAEASEPPSEANSLLDIWSRTETTGPGVDVLERRS